MPGAGGDAQRLEDLSPLRDQSAGLLQVVRRYEQGGLAALRDGSSRPHVSPRATTVEVVGKTMYLRQTYHSARTRSPCTSSDTTTSSESPSGIWRIPEAP